ncbi:MAG: hypothetical protein DRQ51_08035 [Gammaproteobacteria bacterium]|nr:MAG: hypothetical protein DRQ51_08035 [Gammaproteobacteria bacterium]
MKNLIQKWTDNKDAYKNREIGSGVHSFVTDVFKSAIFALKETASKTSIPHSYTHDEKGLKNGRPDFTLFIDDDIIIPCEVKCYTRIKEGERQLLRYQTEFNKKYGILTDGNQWRFYKSTQYKTFYIDDIFNNPQELQIYWQDYIKPENYYLEIFNPTGQQTLFEDELDLNDSLDREIFFDDITSLIKNFKSKMMNLGVMGQIPMDINKEFDKKAVEISYAYLIQFILYKVLVDNRFKTFEKEYKSMLIKIKKAIKDEDFYSIIINEIKNISSYISEKIYIPFKEEQGTINNQLIDNLKKSTLTIETIAPWLDIIIFINRYNFAGLKNEIFGFIYENFLKDLYQEQSKGQYFTDPAVVNLMLKEIGYTQDTIKKQTQQDKISIIDPSCGAGTFLYSAVDKIIDSFDDGTEDKSKYIEGLIDKNIFGLDIEEFPLYLAEMNILMRMLPLIVNDDFENPIDNKLKIFKTKDSISEFLDIGISATEQKIDLLSHLKDTNLKYPSFMRDKDNMHEMLKSLQDENGSRKRFDFVVGNPPYIGYNQCCKHKTDFTLKIKDKNDTSITLGNVYGVNLHSIPSDPKRYRPNPNLYAFFIALGIALLKNNGKLSYIIPQTILTAGDLDVLRYHLSTKTTIEKIITFEGNMFVGRGLKQNRPVPTSSLIFVVRKKEPTEKHTVKIINYTAQTDKKGTNFKKFLQNKEIKTKTFLQSDLRENTDNWNFFKYSDIFRKLLKTYSDINDNIAIYYNHKLSEKQFSNSFYFDGGYNIDEKQMEKTRGFYSYPKIDNSSYLVKKVKGYWRNERIKKDDSNFIGLRQGNQNYKFLDSKYKVIWSYANSKRFFYVHKPVIWARNQFCGIGSDDRSEILYLLSLLNSKINIFILKKLLKSQHEKDFLLSLASIKNFIRVPIITKKNKNIKNKIIKQTENLLLLELHQLKHFVEFTTTLQKFKSIATKDNYLILTDMDNNKIPQKITVKPDFIKSFINDNFNQNDTQNETISLKTLKHTEAIDKKEQDKIKNYIDDLVFCLYFNIEIKKVGLEHAKTIKTICQKNEFYNYIQK